VLLIAGVVIAIVAGRDSGSSIDAAATTPTTVEAATGTSTAGTKEPATTTATTMTTADLPATTVTTPVTVAPTLVITLPPPTTVSPERAAAVRIKQLVAQDQAQADSLVGWWVPQLSAKYVGLTYRGIHYTAAKVLEDHQIRRSRYGAILVDGGVFQFVNNSKPMTGWVITIVPTTFSTAADAQGWCDANGIGSDDCLPKLFPPRS
jgi:hypothetical protein